MFGTLGYGQSPYELQRQQGDAMLRQMEFERLGLLQGSHSLPTEPETIKENSLTKEEKLLLL